MDPTSGASGVSAPSTNLSMGDVSGSSTKAVEESLFAGKLAEQRAWAEAIAKNWKAGADSVKGLSG